jgi:membrane glycosyltransferase
MALCTPCLTRHSTRWRRQWQRRHRHGHILEIARERHVEQALNETPEKLNRDRRLVLLSDPVTMARLHYRVWAAPEKYSSWVNAYQQVTLNPLALKTK